MVYLEGLNNPHDADSGTRKIPFSKEIYIEQEDFIQASIEMMDSRWARQVGQRAHKLSEAMRIGEWP